MNKEHFKSRKFVAFVAGCVITILFVFSGLIGIVIVPQAASAIVNLMTVALASINGMISIYALGQSAVDWKINSYNKSSQENVIEDKEKRVVLEAQKFEMQYEDDDIKVNDDDGFEYDENISRRYRR